MQQIIRNHFFKQIKICQEEGSIDITNSLEKKNTKIFKYGKLNRKGGLTKKGGYKYNIMKLSGYCNETKSLTNRALWWKSYYEYIIQEMRQ